MTTDASEALAANGGAPGSSSISHDRVAEGGESPTGAASAADEAKPAGGARCTDAAATHAPAVAAGHCLSDAQLKCYRARVLKAPALRDDVADELSIVIGLAQEIHALPAGAIPDAADRIAFIFDCLIPDGDKKEPRLLIARDERLRLQIELYRHSGLFRRFLVRLSAGSASGLILIALFASFCIWTIGVGGIRAFYTWASKGGGFAYDARDIFFMDSRALAAITFAALIGGIISIATRLREFSLVRDFDPFAIFLMALWKPLIGVILSVFILATLEGGIISFAFLKDAFAGPNPLAQTTLYILWVFGFLAGFSERFAWDFVDRAQGAISGTADKSK